MKLIICVASVGAVVLLGLALLRGAAAEDTATAKAELKDAKGQDVGVASFTQTPAGVLIHLSVRSMPGGEHAFHIHAVGKCEPPDFASAGGHFNPTNTHHGMMSGPGHAGDMPNLHVPGDGSLDVEVLNTAVTLDKERPNSVFHPGGTAVVIHAGKDDYTSDPAGNAGGRIACGVVAQ
jgi:superoxide dismutase, Cu-Zn family